MLKRIGIALVALSFVGFGILLAQSFSVNSTGDITAHSINLIPSCTGYLYNNGGTLSCQSGTGSGGGGATLGPSVSATNEDGQSISSGVNILSFTDNVWDTGNIHPTTGDLTKFTAPSAGFYLASVSTLSTSNSVGFQLFFKINNINVDGAGVSQTTGTGQMNSAGAYSAILQLNAGDVVQGFIYSTSSFMTTPYYSTMQLTKLASNF